MANMKADARRAHIVEAAVEITLRDGLSAATVRAVASAMGAAPAHIHHHFPSASALRAEALRAAAERVAPFSPEKLQGLPSRRQLLIALIGDGEAADVNAIALWNDGLIAARQDDGIKAVVRAAMIDCIAALAKLIEDGQASGEFSAAADAGEAALGLMTMVMGMDQFSGLGINSSTRSNLEKAIESEIRLRLDP